MRAERSKLFHAAIRIILSTSRLRAANPEIVMQAKMLILAALFAALPGPARAHEYGHEYGQDAAPIEAKQDLTTERRAARDDGVNGEEAHPEIAALVNRTGPCAEFRVRASRGNSRAETTHIEKCH